MHLFELLGGVDDVPLLVRQGAAAGAPGGVQIKEVHQEVDNVVPQETRQEEDLHAGENVPPVGLVFRAPFERPVQPPQVLVQRQRVVETEVAEHAADEELARDVVDAVRLLPKRVFHGLKRILPQRQHRPQLTDLPPLAFPSGILVMKRFGCQVVDLREAEFVRQPVLFLLGQFQEFVGLLRFPFE